jgi:hypothetical protein
MKTVEVKEGQSLLDIAVQEYGTTEAVRKLATLNGFSSLSAALQVGSFLKVENDTAFYTNSRKETKRRETLAQIQKRGLIIYNNNSNLIIPGTEQPTGVLWIDGDGAFIIDGDGAFIETE